MLESLARSSGRGCCGNATGELLDFESHATTARQRVRLVRDDGALTSLPVALTAWRGSNCSAAESALPNALVDEAHAIAAAIGAPDMREPKGSCG